MLSTGQSLRDRYRIDTLPDPANGLLVYRAYDTVENRVCAIREFEGEQAARLEREAESLTLHRHPNLPTAYDAFILEGCLYIVLEWPEGESMQARLKRDGRLPEADAIRHMMQILAALDYIHTLNLPMARGGFASSNIWVAPDGRPRLYAGVASITNAAPYTAPEGSSDPKASIYTAGATLYNLLTGRSPEGNTNPLRHNPSISTATANVVQRALNRRPESRFASIRDMRKALGRAKSGDTVAIPIGNSRTFPIVPIMIGIIAIALTATAIFFVRSGIPVASVTTSTAPSIETSLAIATQPPSPAATQTTKVNTAPQATATVPSPTQTQAATETTLPKNTATSTPNTTPQVGTTAIAEADKMVLVFVPAGEFIMGSVNDDPEAFGNEKPQHTVFLDDFWIDQTEVTNAQYQLCVEDGGCTEPINLNSISHENYYNEAQFADYPVIWVNWLQARDYCDWAGRRLPSEEEWEKAARGTDGRLYPWGDQPPDNTLLNYNLAGLDTIQVGSFPSGASPYGALDMAGNVLEWVDGPYYDSYFVVLRNTETPTPYFDDVRIIRSSAWNDILANIRIASRRYSKAAISAYQDVGFRCAVSEMP
jgi:formylglycine-generating enzyme required for sulfatase activity